MKKKLYDSFKNEAKSKVEVEELEQIISEEKLSATGEITNPLYT